MIGPTSASLPIVENSLALRPDTVLGMAERLQNALEPKTSGAAVSDQLVEAALESTAATAACLDPVAPSTLEDRVRELQTRVDSLSTRSLPEFVRAADGKVRHKVRSALYTACGWPWSAAHPAPVPVPANDVSPLCKRCARS